MYIVKLICCYRSLNILCDMFHKLPFKLKRESRNIQYEICSIFCRNFAPGEADRGF